MQSKVLVLSGVEKVSDHGTIWSQKIFTSPENFCGKVNRHKERKTERQTETDRQTDEQTDRQTDRKLWSMDFNFQ